MDIKKYFTEQKIEPVQDRKDGMDYWENYELFTYNDLMECMEDLVNKLNEEKYDQGFHDGCNKTAIELSKSDTVDETERLECLCVSWCTGSNQLNKVFKCGNKFVSNGTN